MVAAVRDGLSFGAPTEAEVEMAAPSQFEAMFLSAAHMGREIEAILEAARETAKTIQWC